MPVREDLQDDLVIAFESLFVNGEGNQFSPREIVPVACAALLAKTHEEGRRIKFLLTKTWSLRNCIVHGSDCPEIIAYDNWRYTLPAFVSIIEDYLRESLKALM
jgi:hypothetical protein